MGRLLVQLNWGTVGLGGVAPPRPPCYNGQAPDTSDRETVTVLPNIISTVSNIRLTLESSVNIQKKSHFSFTAGQLDSLYRELVNHVRDLAASKGVEGDANVEQLVTMLRATADLLGEGTAHSVGFAYGQWNSLSDTLKDFLEPYTND